MIPYGRQLIDDDDIEQVVSVLQSDFLTQGDRVPAFEAQVANYSNSKYGVAVTSATSALHLACLALGVSKGDIVWTSPNTFVATANCAIYCGAEVGFIDIDPVTLNLCVVELEKKLKIAKKLDRIPKVVIPVHFAGNPCDMERIFHLSIEYGFKIIEDASHAIGSSSRGFKTGSCKYSDITVFSFHPVKIITTGEGGMALTNNEPLYQKMILLRSHGVVKNLKIYEPWFYDQIDLGFNYRMTDIQAALGSSQLNKLDKFLGQRNLIATVYGQELKHLPLTLPSVLDGVCSSFHLYVVRLQLDRLSYTRHEIFNKLISLGIGVNVHYMPVYLHSYYRKIGYKKGLCPQSEAYYQEAISLPIHPSLGSEGQKIVINAIEKVLS